MKPLYDCYSLIKYTGIYIYTVYNHWTVNNWFTTIKSKYNFQYVTFTCSTLVYNFQYLYIITGSPLLKYSFQFIYIYTLSNQTPKKQWTYSIKPYFFPGFCRSRCMIHPDLPGAHPSFGSGLHGGTMGFHHGDVWWNHGNIWLWNVLQYLFRISI